MFYSINKNFYFDSRNDNTIRVKSKEQMLEISGVETVLVSTEKDRVVILVRGEESDILHCYSLDGVLIFKVEPPEHYSFWYLGEVDKIACNAKDEYAERSPLSGWWFEIDLDTGEVTKGSPAY